jgi:hypothetical protein
MDGALVGAGSLCRGAKHPVTSSARRWFPLSFCTPFSALHSSARNHATRFSMFFQKAKKFLLLTFNKIAPMLFWANL